MPSPPPFLRTRLFAEPSPPTHPLPSPVLLQQPNQPQEGKPSARRSPPPSWPPPPPPPPISSASPPPSPSTRWVPPLDLRRISIRPICSIRRCFTFFLLSGGGFQRRRPGGGLRGVRDLPRQDRAPGDGPCQGMRPRLLVRFPHPPNFRVLRFNYYYSIIPIAFAGRPRLSLLCSCFHR
jgi:hypothetical protein